MEEWRTGEELDVTNVDEVGAAWEQIELPRGAEVGRYVVVDTVGSGATGVVYAAYDPELDRRVALKVLHRRPGDSLSESGGSSSTGRARMQREAQALARLRHPNIVTIHDVGKLGDQLFLAMEFVAGKTLAAWVESEPRTPESTVEVYIQAGRGLAAAHAKELVHRDFKPDNVIVGDDGVVRVLDFGLARAVRDGGRPAAGAPAPEASLVARDPGRSPGLDSQLTMDGVLVGTPAFMSPEQHMGLPAGPASDQFSFCVALHLALTKQSPFEGEDLVSRSASVVAGRRRPMPADARVPRHVARALDRGLAVKPEDRWPTMDALLEELDAAPASMRPRLIGLGVGALVLGGLLAVAAGTGEHPADACAAGSSAMDASWSAESRQRLGAAFEATGLPYAARAAERTRGAIDDWVTDWKAEWSRACDATHREHRQSVDRLERRLECLEGQRQDLEALVEVLADSSADRMERSLDGVVALGDPSSCAARDQGVAEELPPEVRAELARGLASVRAFASTGDESGARQAAEQLLAEAEEAGALEFQARAHLEIAHSMAEEGNTESELDHLRRAYLAAERLADDGLRARASRRLALNLSRHAKQRPYAEAWLERARAIHERATLGEDAQVDLDFIEGRVELEAGHFDRAIELFRSSAEASERLAPDQPLAGRAAWGALATAYRDKAMYPEALAIDLRLLELSQQHYGEEHPETAHAISNYGSTLYMSGDYQRAADAFERSLAMIEQTIGRGSVAYANRLNNLGAALDRLGQPEDALGAYIEALKIGEERWGKTDKRVAPYLENLGTVYTSLGRHQDAHDVLIRSHAIRQEAYGADHPRTALSELNLGYSKFKLGQHDDAIELLEHGLGIWEASLGKDYADNGLFENNIGDVLRGKGDCAAAIPRYRRALALFEPTYGKDYSELLYPLTGLGACLAATGETDEAREALERALKVGQDASFPPGYRATTQFELARLVDDETRAESLAREALADAKKEPGELKVAAIEAWLAAR